MSGFFSEIVRLTRKTKLRYGSQKTVIRTLRKMGMRVGERCRIYTLKFGSEPWLIRIGNHVCISNDVAFFTHGLNWPLQDKHESLTGFGTITVLDNVQIGPGAAILPNVTIGPDAIVGANSVVTKDVPPGTVVAGNPARHICTLEEYEERCLEKHIDIPLDRSAARRVLEERLWGGDSE